MANEHYPQVDGTRIVVRSDGQWSICWPNGTYTRGNAETHEAALEAATALHHGYIIAQWLKGEPGHGGSWKAPNR